MTDDGLVKLLVVCEPSLASCTRKTLFLCGLLQASASYSNRHYRFLILSCVQRATAEVR